MTDALTEKTIENLTKPACGCPSSGHLQTCIDFTGKTGYGYDKASYNSADFNSIYLGKWNPPYVSHNTSYLPEREQMVARVLDTVRNNGVAAGAVDVWVDHLCSTYTPDPMPMYKCLGWNEEDAMEWAETILEFIEKFLMDESFIDAAGHCNFVELLQMAARSEFIYGEVIAKIEWKRKSVNTPLQTSFDFIDPGRVRTPLQYMGKLTNDNFKEKVIDGFLRNSSGNAKGAYVFDSLFNDRQIDEDDDFSYCPMKGRNETGHRDLLIHIYKKELPGQTRGVSKFAPILEGMKMHKQLMREILLATQFRNKVLGVFKSVRDSKSISNDLGMNQGFAMPGQSDLIKGESGFKDDLDPRFDGLSPKGREMAKRLAHHNMMGTKNTMGGVEMVHTWPDEEMEIHQPNNTSIATTALSQEMSFDAAAGTSIPTNMIHRHYASGTYSGLRSGRLDFFQAIRASKPRIDQLANCILRHAMDEAIAKGYVKLPKRVERQANSQGLSVHEYFKQNIGTIMKTKWLGPPEKLIDPNKEILGYFNGERYGYLNPGEIVGKVNGETYSSFLEKRRRHCKQKIDAQIECDEYETRKRLELNQKLIDEGLIVTENSIPGQEDTTSNETEGSEPIFVEVDKNVESPLQDIVQSEEGQNLDTENFILGNEDQLIPERGRPTTASTVGNKLDPFGILKNKNDFSNGFDIAHKEDTDDIVDRVADAVLEKIEALLEEKSTSQATNRTSAPIDEE
jgi:capsid protein